MQDYEHDAKYSIRLMMYVEYLGVPKGEAYINSILY